MSEQQTGKHLSKAPAEVQDDRQPAKAGRPVNTARFSGRQQPAPARPAPDAVWEDMPEENEGAEKRRGRSPFNLFVRSFVLALLFIAMGALVFVLIQTKMLTGKLLLVICGLLLVVFVLVAVLIFAFGKNHLPWGGIIVSLLLTAVMAAGCVLGNQSTNTLQTITSNTYTSSHIGVYVRNDDPAQSMDELSGYSFGVLELLDNEGVDKALANINSQLGTTVQTTSFKTPTELVNALFDGQVNAVITDAVYVEALNELDNYAERLSQMREVTKMRVQIAKPTEEPVEEKVEEEEVHTYTVLITGIDSRNGLVRSSLSDVNILVTVNTDTRQVLFVNTPRDYKVPFSNTGVADKLTHAGWYGEEVCMGTIGDLYDVDIDYYFRINFEGFVNIIDALGGVTINCPYTFDSMNVPGYHFDEGEMDLNGEQALVFVRERFAFEDGDAQRGRNQLEVIRGVIKKVMSPELLVRYSSLLTAVEGSFETTVPYDLIASLIRRQLDEGGDWNIVSYSVGGEGTHEVSPVLGEEVYMTIPDETTVQTAKDLMAQVFNGETISEPPAPEATDEPTAQ